MSEAPAIVVYSSPFCGFCTAAKKLLEKKGVEYEEIDTLLDGARREEMVARSQRTTVPQIFIGDRHIGGYDDLRALDDRGQLDELLARAVST
jgi:glutaredoxin 3